MGREKSRDSDQGLYLGDVSFKVKLEIDFLKIKGIDGSSVKRRRALEALQFEKRTSRNGTELNWSESEC